jgi:hypothetical protein
VARSLPHTHADRSVPGTRTRARRVDHRMGSGPPLIVEDHLTSTPHAAGVAPLGTQRMPATSLCHVGVYETLLTHRREGHNIDLQNKRILQSCRSGSALGFVIPPGWSTPVAPDKRLLSERVQQYFLNRQHFGCAFLTRLSSRANREPDAGCCRGPPEISAVAGTSPPEGREGGRHPCTCLLPCLLPCAASPACPPA